MRPIVSDIYDWLNQPRSIVKQKEIGMFELNPLTTREREVLALLAQGKSNREIAADLVLSVKTVEGYVHNILDKLYVDNRTQAAILYQGRTGH